MSYELRIFPLWAVCPDMPTDSYSSLSQTLDRLRRDFSVPSALVSALRNMKTGEEWGDVIRFKSKRGSVNLVVTCKEGT